MDFEFDSAGFYRPRATSDASLCRLPKTTRNCFAVVCRRCIDELIGEGVAFEEFVVFPVPMDTTCLLCDPDEGQT